VATTSTRIALFANGLRDTTGAVVASGLARFYQPGTLTTQTVYSDAACTTAYTQPITLNAGGQATIYTLEAVRCIAKDATDSVTLYDDIINLQRHDAVYVTSAGFNSGAETTLENALAEFTTSTGAGANLKESTGASARAIKTVVYERMISVKDFGAVGDGTTPDDAAIQAASDRVEALGGGIVYFPKGTYLVNATLAIDTAGVSWQGAGRGISIIKNAQTAANALNVNLGSATDCKLFIRDLSFTASTTSSGTGINVANGDRIHICNVSVALHRTGIATAATTSPWLERVWIESTDDNSAGVGVSLGIRGRIENSEIVCGTANGTGVSASGTDGRVEDCYVSKFATGVALSGARSVARGGHVTTATTGLNLSAAGCKAIEVYVTAATTGIQIGGVAGCWVEGCEGASNTTDFSVNVSATGLREFNNFTTYSASGGALYVTYPERYQVAYTTSSSTTPSWTPTHSPHLMQILECTATSAVTLTINNPTTTNAQPGDVIWLQIAKTGANSISGVTWGNKYANILAAPWTNAPGGVSSGQWLTLTFMYDGSVYREIDRATARST